MSFDMSLGAANNLGLPLELCESIYIMIKGLILIEFEINRLFGRFAGARGKVNQCRSARASSLLVFR